MERAVQAGDHDRVQAAVANARRKFCLQLEERADELCDDLVELFEPNSPETVEKSFISIKRQAHKLHGLAAMIGFPRVGGLAATLESQIDLRLEGPRPLEAKFIQELLDELLAEIDEVLNDT